MSVHEMAAAQKAPDLTPPVKGTQKKEAAPKAEKAPKEPKTPKEPRVSSFAKIYPDTGKIMVLTEGGKNPKRPGTAAHKTFELYATNKTVGEFIKAGGFYAALSWDVGHGFIKVEA